MMSEEKLKAAADALDELKTWLAVFQTENELSDEAMKQLSEKVDAVGQALGEFE